MEHAPLLLHILLEHLQCHPWSITQRKLGENKKQKLLKREIEEVPPTTCNGKLFLSIWGQTFPFIELNLKVNWGIAIFFSSFVCFSFNIDVKAHIMSGNCESCICPPQEPLLNISRKTGLVDKSRSWKRQNKSTIRKTPLVHAVNLLEFCFRVPIFEEQNTNLLN